MSQVFGSQLISSNSKTPYSDATQVRKTLKLFFLYEFERNSNNTQNTTKTYNIVVLWMVCSVNVIEGYDTDKS